MMFIYQLRLSDHFFDTFSDLAEMVQTSGTLAIPNGISSGWTRVDAPSVRQRRGARFLYPFSVWISFTKTTLRQCIAMNIYLDGLLYLCIQTRLHNDGATPSGILYLNSRSLPCLKLSFNLKSDLMKSASFGRIEID
jgi:hypothetical protein